MEVVGACGACVMAAAALNNLQMQRGCSGKRVFSKCFAISGNYGPHNLQNRGQARQQYQHQHPPFILRFIVFCSSDKTQHKLPKSSTTIVFIVVVDHSIGTSVTGHHCAAVGQQGKGREPVAFYLNISDQFDSLATFPEITVKEDNRFINLYKTSFVRPFNGL